MFVDSFDPALVGMEADKNDAKLTPFVTKNMEPLRGSYKPNAGPLSGENYIENWRKYGYI